VLRSNAKVDLLKSVPLFSRLSKAELRKLAGVADEIDLQEGTTLTRQGASGREFMVLVEGNAKVERNGRRINRLGPGDFLGEIALISGSPRTATVTTETPVRVLVLTDRAFHELLTDSPTVAIKVLEAVGERLPPERV
jgi:CRP/FNR family transcriptional regulator, cyclic AMP receptor protein